MEPLLQSLEFTFYLVIRMGPVMFVSLFGIELLMQMGLMKYLRPFGEPVAKSANLPSESALSFLSAIGSMIAAHTMAAGFRADNKINDRELLLTGVLNTVPFHFKETLTFQLPIVLPLLGFKLCMIYIAVFWLTGILKILFVIAWGRLFLDGEAHDHDAFENLECSPDDEDCIKRSFARILADTWQSRHKMYFRMIGILSAVTFLVQFLMYAGFLGWLENVIDPLTSLFNLPSAVIGPVSTYIFSPTAGITYMSSLLLQNVVSAYQAIVALLAGGILMIPVTRLRRTMPRYAAIFGLKNGLKISAVTTGLSLLARIIVLVWVLIFF